MKFAKFYEDFFYRTSPLAASKQGGKDSDSVRVFQKILGFAL